jgi:ubiquinone/menaquinone biosynthesis C-methylase UbiE
MASQWESNPARVKLAGAVGRAISRIVPMQPHWRVLDYGAGTGLLTLCLQPRVGALLAVDASGGMLEVLSSKLPRAGIGNVQVRQCDLVRQSLGETDFDLVTGSMMLHHIRDVPLLLNRLANLLKPGGWLAVADLDLEDGSFHGQADDVFHHGFDRAQVANWLGDAGLENVRVEDAHSMTKPDATGQLRSYGIFLAAGQKVQKQACQEAQSAALSTISTAKPEG